MMTLTVTFEPHKPPVDWNYWGRIVTASLDQAITLSQDLCPDQFCGLRINPQQDDFLTRRAVVLNRMGCEVSDLAPVGAFGMFPAPLVEVGETLMEAGFTLPNKYPRRAGSQIQYLPLPGADWTLWANMPKSTLREAVLLSLDLEPKPPVLTFTQHETPKRYAEPGREYDRRLSIASAHIDAAGPLRPLGHLPLLNGPTGAIVSLGEFAAWAIGMGWELPELFPRATAPAQPPAPMAAEPAQAAALPVADGAPEQSLPTKDISFCFDGVNGWSADRWQKNLSGSDWLHPARTALGEQGGAPSMWNPLTLAQIVCDNTKGKRPKAQILKCFNSRFSINPVLDPWKTAFNEYFAMFSEVD